VLLTKKESVCNSCAIYISRSISHGTSQPSENVQNALLSSYYSFICRKDALVLSQTVPVDDSLPSETSQATSSTL
jgi:hypothetical protein